MMEGWRDIPGYEGLYQVSTLGWVKSLERRLPCGDGHSHTHSERLLKGRPIGNMGYTQVTLTKDRVKRFFYVHRLVLLAFVGPCPVGLEACHANDLPTDNRLENLRWDTRLANMADRDARGGTLRGEAVKGSKLTADNVREIRSSSAPRKQLAARYGVTRSLIDQVILGYIWKHVA